MNIKLQNSGLFAFYDDPAKKLIERAYSYNHGVRHGATR